MDEYLNRQRLGFCRIISMGFLHFVVESAAEPDIWTINGTYDPTTWTSFEHPLSNKYTLAINAACHEDM